MAVSIPKPSGCGNLLLSRKEGQTIVVDNRILITVEEIGRKHARISVRAPRNIRVDRKEVHDRRSQQLLSATMAR